MKHSLFLKEEDLLGSAKEFFLQYLREVPFLRLLHIGPGGEDGPGTDIVAIVQAGTREVRFLIQVKSSGEPGIVRQAAYRVLEHQRARLESIPPPNKGVASGTIADSDDYLVLAAPYIGDKSAALCREMGIGYFDFQGNCNFTFGQIYLSKTNFPRPVTRPPGKYLYSPKSQAVLRVLVENPGRKWRTLDLAKEANVSSGQVSITRNLLRQKEWVTNDSRGITLKEPIELLRDWATHLARKTLQKNQIHDYYSLDPLPEIEAKIGKLSTQDGYRLALTGPAGAARIAPYTRYNRVTAYTAGTKEDVAERLGLRPVDSGANVRLIVPSEEGVFYGTTTYEGVPVVCATQLFLDLNQMGGRNVEAANYLLEEVIQLRWRISE